MNMPLRISTSLRLYIPRLFTLGMLLLGAFLWEGYFAAPSIRIAAPKQGFGGAMSRAVHLDRLTLILDTQEDPVQFIVEAAFHLIYVPPEERGPAYVLFVIPFAINTVYAGSYSDKWIVLRNSKPWVASLIYTQVSNDSVTLNSTARYGQFGIDRTFETAQRGIFTIVLPFETGVGGSDFPEVDDVQEQLRIGFLTPPTDYMEVYLTLPYSAENVQAFPEPTSQSPYVRRTDNQTANSIYWVLNQRHTLTVSFEDSNIRLKFDAMVVLGSLLLGVGAQGILDYLNGISKHERRKLRDEWKYS